MIRYCMIHNWYSKLTKAQHDVQSCTINKNFDLSHSTTKPTKWSVRPAKTQISLRICPVWSVFAVHSMGSWGPKVSSCGQQRLWSDWEHAQADPSLCWAHITLLVLLCAGHLPAAWHNMKCLLTIIFLPVFNTYEPHHDKTCLRGFRPAKTQTSLLSYRDKLVLKNWFLQVWVSYYVSSKQQRCWSDCADAQADLHLCCSHTAKKGFFMTWLI